MGWYVYIVECADTTYYTGITTDITRRIEEHEKGTGAKYTKGRGPLNLIYQEKCADRSSASKREIEIKSLSKAEKLVLISS
ncbi:MAG: endonuclease [Zetaproteobacteria bacterium]|nr:MAG: endonuclease [Zetaproteobacteria bacterium]